MGPFSLEVVGYQLDALQPMDAARLFLPLSPMHSCHILYCNIILILVNILKHI